MKAVLNKWWVVATFALALSLLFPNAAVKAAGKNEIVIGANIPLTGALASSGVELRWSYEQAVKDINAKGGIFVKEYNKKLPVKLIIEDGQSNAGKAAQAVERLIKVDKVDLLLGGFAAPFSVIPGCTVAEKYHKYYHTSISLVPPWLSRHFKWSTLFFFNLKQACSNPFIIWNSLPPKERPKRPALLMEDTFDGRAFAGIFRPLAKKYGYKFAMDEALAVGSKDYTAQILKAKKLGVDAILIFTNPSDCITFIRQMKQNNYSVPYLHGWKGTWEGEFWKALGPDAQYVLMDGFWSSTFPFKGNKRLGRLYEAKFHKPSVSVGATYALAQILFQAIQDAGTLDGAKVRQAVLTHTFHTLMGPVKYAPDGVATFTSIAAQWINGRQVLIYPFKWAKHKVQLAPPWNQRKKM